MASESGVSTSTMLSSKGSITNLAAMAGTPRTSVMRTSITSRQIQGLSLEAAKEALLGLFPDDIEFVEKHVISALCPSMGDYSTVHRLLNENMDQGLAKSTHETAQVPMYCTYVRDVPNGKEAGRSLALDFGSHHLRLEMISLDNGRCEVDSKNGFVPEKLLKGGTAEQLFDYLANFLYKFLKDRNLLNTTEALPLGFTFAFPCQRLALNRAILTRWTKSFHCEGVEGQEVVALLENAIFKKGEMNIIIDAVVNDTVGTLLSGALQDPTCAIGLVLSKGSNACYIERLENVEVWDGDDDPPLQVVIDTEWGMFGTDGCLEFIRNDYDRDIDGHSNHPGKSIYDKMQSGEYIGEQVRLVLQKLKEHELLFQDHWPAELDARGRFYTKYISEILSDEDIRFLHTRHVFEDFQIVASELECRAVHHICQLVSTRAAMFAALGIASLIDRVDRDDVGIAADGSTYRYHPTFKSLLQQNIPLFLKTQKTFRFVTTTDGCGLGAALAAAVTERIKLDKTRPPTTETDTQTSEAQSQQEPVNPAPVDSASVDPASVDSAPVDPSTVNPPSAST